MPFADRLQADFDAFNELYRPDDLLGYAVPDFASGYVNTLAGERRTYGAGRVGSTVKVWLVGGSAAFGFGQRDDHTVPSWLARLAEDDGFSVEVHNLAMNGWVLPQGVRAVVQRLESADPLPDAVVFYDGWNDVFISVQVAVARSSLPVAEFELNADDSRVAIERVRSGEALAAIEEAGGRQALVDLTVARYEWSMREARAALEPLGIRAAYFFQPDASAGAVQREAVAGYGSVAPVQDLPVMAETAAATADALEARGVTNLRDVFAGTDEPVFIDPVHTNETGARIVASAMYRQLLPQLRSAAGG